jgi:hypothetical protein
LLIQNKNAPAIIRGVRVFGNINQTAAAAVSNFSNVHGSLARFAFTAGVVFNVECFRTQLYQAKYRPSIASWFRRFLLWALVNLVNLRGERPG